MSCVKKVISTCAAFAVIAGAAEMARADAGVALDASSSYVFRGAEVDDDAALFGQAEVSGHGFTVNTWAWFDTDSATDQDIGEVDLTITYALPTEAVDASVGIIEYLYPGQATSQDREIVASLGAVDVPLNPVLTAYFGIEGAVDSDIYVTLAVSHAVELDEGIDLEIGASAAWQDDDDAGTDGLAEGTVSAAISYALSEETTVGANVVYSTNLDDQVLTDAAAFDDVYGGVSVSHAL